MTVDVVRTEIVKALSSGNFVSGQELGQQMGLSRSAIANHIKTLSNLGLDIFKVTGKGYKLSSPLIMISRDELAKRLSTSVCSTNLINVLNVVGSTNDEIKRRISALEKGAVYVAEAQTNGRGRRGRKWVSPYGASIYLSMLWRFESGYESISGLSLGVGLAVRRAIAKSGFDDVYLKWPNDVYINNKKLAGVLIELEGQLGGATEVVIGIGININLPMGDLGINQEYIDLQTVMGRHINRNKICAAIIEELWALLQMFESSGIAPLIQEWREADLYLDKHVVLIAGKERITGICRGINETGALLLETNLGIKAFHGGEVSVRPDQSATT